MLVRCLCDKWRVIEGVKEVCELRLCCDRCSSFVDENDSVRLLHSSIGDLDVHRSVYDYDQSILHHGSVRICYRLRGGSRPAKAMKKTAPDKGSFPLDHHSQCKQEMEEYKSCLYEKKKTSWLCKPLAKAYFQCRMDR